MNRFWVVGTMIFAAALGTRALAQTANSPPGSGAVSGTMSPAVHVDSGINAKGSARQQSPAADANGTPMTLPSAPAKPNTPDGQNNALTSSPKGPGSGGNDATK